MLNQEDKKELIKQALDEDWGVTGIMELWDALGFSSKQDMSENIIGMQSRVVIPKDKVIFQSDVLRYWLEYQYAAIDGRIEVAKQVSQDNIFRHWLAI